MKNKVSKAVRRAVKKLPKSYFIEVLSEGTLRWENYRTDKFVLGKAMAVHANNYYSRYCKIQPEAANLNGMANIFLELGLIEPKGQQFSPVENWEKVLDGMFPGEITNTEEQPRVEEAVVEEEKVVEPAKTDVPPQNVYELYLEVLGKVDNKLVTRDDLKTLVTECLPGVTPDRSWMNNRMTYLTKDDLMESLVDSGITYYSRRDSWKEVLEKRKIVLSRTSLPTTVVEKKVVEEVPEKTTPTRTTLVRISVRDIKKFDVLEVVFEGTEEAVVRVENSPGLIDLLEETPVSGVSKEDYPEIRKEIEERLAEYTKKAKLLQENLFV